MKSAGQLWKDTSKTHAVREETALVVRRGGTNNDLPTPQMIVVFLLKRKSLEPTIAEGNRDMSDLICVRR